MKVNAYHEDKKDGAWANGHQGFQDKSEKKKKQLEIPKKKWGVKGKVHRKKEEEKNRQMSVLGR